MTVQGAGGPQVWAPPHAVTGGGAGVWTGEQAGGRVGGWLGGGARKIAAFRVYGRYSDAAAVNGWMRDWGWGSVVEGGGSGVAVLLTTRGDHMWGMSGKLYHIR